MQEVEILEWEDFKENIMQKSFVNYKNELVIIMRMHIDGITPANQEILVSFKYDFKENLETLGFEKDSLDKNNYVEEHIKKIKTAFKKKLDEIFVDMGITGNSIEFYFDDSGKVRYRHRSIDKHFKFREIKPSRG